MALTYIKTNLAPGLDMLTVTGFTGVGTSTSGTVESIALPDVLNRSHLKLRQVRAIDLGGSEDWDLVIGVQNLLPIDFPPNVGFGAADIFAENQAGAYNENMEQYIIPDVQETMQFRIRNNSTITTNAMLAAVMIMEY